ncbi:hypothetical protein J5500_02825 [Candidatus Saccharibacteria bacterium]|nr:hypothetical protein [Candidatus Saccharibacteria bacterium]
MAKKREKIKQTEEAYKIKPMVIIIVAVFLCAALTLALVFIRPFAGETKDPAINPSPVDCMPPIDQSTQECLDSGQCYCGTY